MKQMSAPQHGFLVGIKDTSGTIDRSQMMSLIKEIEDLSRHMEATDFKILYHDKMEDKPTNTRRYPPKCWYHNPRKKY